MHFTVDDINFCDVLYVKYKSCATTAHDLLDLYMGLLVKTWLLIVYTTAFYAIIQTKTSKHILAVSSKPSLFAHTKFYSS